ncbi:MAG: hypothetical protein ACI9OJ_003109 [Myxococcota bacterium]|jgi:hypothetical protein
MSVTPSSVPALAPWVVSIAFLVGCSASTETTAAPDAGSSHFAGGEFQLQVERVDDGCLDGSLAVVFMPNGTQSAYPLANPTWIPGAEDVPTTYVMKLNAPFQDMSMTMEAGQGDQFVVKDAPQNAVPLNLAAASDCVVDMVFDATVDLVSSDSIAMSVRVTMTDFRSESEACPAPSAPACAVTLDLTGTRIQPR